MALTYTLSNTANKYGLNAMPVTPSLMALSNSILGQSLEPTVTENGVSAVATVNSTTGFTFTATVTALSQTSFNVTSLVLSKGADTIATYIGNTVVSLSNLASLSQPDFLLSGADFVNGNAFNNALKGYGGNDRIDGGAGTDSAYFSGFKSQYQISKSGTAFITSGVDGTDTLLNIERLIFDDKAVAYDIEGSAGQAYRLYQAAFDRKPDPGGLGTWINYMDQGHSLKEVSGLFQQSTEFVTRYSANPSTADFVTLLYQNVLHRTPDAGGFNTWTTLLDTNQWSRADVLIGFSESPENKGATLVGVQNGMEYFPVA